MSSSRIIFIAFAVLYVALVWTGRYVPTQDGPSHLANAAALRDVLLPGDQGLEAAYSVPAPPPPELGLLRRGGAADDLLTAARR